MNAPVEQTSSPAAARVASSTASDVREPRLLTEVGHEVLGIDSSHALVAAARDRAPKAQFRVGSFVDSPLPERCDAILAIGEVLGYRFDPRCDRAVLDRVLDRAARALRRRGLLTSGIDLEQTAALARGGRAVEGR